MKAADIFGYVCWNLDDTAIGQQIELLGEPLDYISPMLFGKNMGHCLYCRLRRGIDAVARGVVTDDARGEIDDAAAIAHPPRPFSHPIEGACQIDGNLLPKILIRNLSQWREFADPGIVDEHVDLSGGRRRRGEISA